MLFKLTFYALYWRNESIACVSFKNADLYVADCSVKALQLFSEKKVTRAKAKATFFNPSGSQIKSVEWSQK